MEGHCSTGQSPQWAVVPMEGEEQEQEQEEGVYSTLNTEAGSFSECQYLTSYKAQHMNRRISSLKKEVKVPPKRWYLTSLKAPQTKIPFPSLKMVAERCPETFEPPSQITTQPTPEHIILS